MGLRIAKFGLKSEKYIRQTEPTDLTTMGANRLRSNFNDLLRGMTMGKLVAGLLAACWFAVICGCQPESSAQDKTPTPPKVGFAEGRVPKQGDTKIERNNVDGDRAMKYLKQLCDLGPRISGSDGMKKQQELLTKHFEALGGTVTRQEFSARQRRTSPSSI
jgi:hypothetical protein